jgi:hypothetical protein
VGNVLRVKKNDDPIRIGLIRPTDYKNIIIPITDPNNYYKSRIQKGAEAKGSYLAFAVNFKADQLAELELVDIARASVAFDNDSVFQHVIDKATIWVREHPYSDTSIKRLWIKSVVLTRRIYEDFTNVGVKASGQVGDVVGVSTGVYNKSEQSIKSVIIAFEAFDIDELVKQTSVPYTFQKDIPQIDSLQTTPSPKSVEYIKDFTIYTGSINGKIK